MSAQWYMLPQGRGFTPEELAHHISQLGISADVMRALCELYGMQLVADEQVQFQLKLVVTNLGKTNSDDADELAGWRELGDHAVLDACNSIWPDRYLDDRTRAVAQRLLDGVR